MSGFTIRPGVAFSADEQRMLDEIRAQPRNRAATLLRDLARTCWRQGERAKFAELYRLSYCERPNGQLADLAQHPGKDSEVYTIARTLADHGVLFAPVVSQLAFAAARAGRQDELRQLFDYGRFFRTGVGTPPAGTTSEAFHAAVAREIKADLVYYDSPNRRAIRRGWRNNAVIEAKTPALAALRAILQAEMDRYVAALPDDPHHPFLAVKGRPLRLGGWAVVSGPESHHEAHIHPAAWITGVYYVSQPPVSRGSTTGWLRVGPPAKLDERWETRMVEPAVGHFVLMPAYFSHNTEPMGVDEERICIAFEAQHAEIGPEAAEAAY